VIDPFVLFSRSYNAPTEPIPDVTTLNGRRIFFSTIQPDGWLSVLPAKKFGDVPPVAAEVLERRFIATHPEIPVTVGLLTGDLDPAEVGPVAERSRLAARAIFAHRSVAPATAGHSLVRDWDFFAAYDPSLEAETLSSALAPTAVETSLVTSAVRSLKDAFAQVPRTALDRNPGAPRKYAATPFELSNETVHALEEVAALSPSGATAAFIWSGDARPFPAALAAVQDAGAPAIGGGGGFAHDAAPSITNLWPIAAPSGDGLPLQIYSALSGDEAYTNHWSAPLFGFQALDQTLSRTEAPRRLKPFQLSYAAQSALDFGTRRAVERHLDAARDAEVIPVAAADYVRIAEGFSTYRAQPDGRNAWKVHDRGALQTVRFDNAQHLALDMAASQGVIGARRKADALYIALDPATAQPRIALAESGVPTGVLPGTRALALASSRLQILAVHHDSCAARATVAGLVGGDMTWVGEPGTTYKLTLFAGGSATPLHWEQATSDAEGRVSFAVPLSDPRPHDLTLAGPCAEG
jgi:hypothetical protein